MVQNIILHKLTSHRKNNEYVYILLYLATRKKIVSDLHPYL